MADTGAPQRVVIIGAGLTGLLTAQGLQKNGYKVTVYEQEAVLGERVREWTMLVHWALPAFRKILPEDLVTSMNVAHTDPFYQYQDQERIPYFNGATGDLLFRMPASEMRRVSKNRFRRNVAQGLEIHWGKKFKDIRVDGDGPVKVIFEDGDSAEADFVVGADGAKSMVRRWLVGEEEGTVTESDYVMASSIAHYNDAEKGKFVRAPHPVSAIALHPEGAMFAFVQDVKDPEDAATWSFHVGRLWKGEPMSMKGDEAISFLKGRCKDVCEPFRSAIQWIPEGSMAFVGTLLYWPPVQWDNRGNRVTLAGDAAHAMLPSRGQGLNHCLQDVQSLVAHMASVKQGTATLAEAVKAYETEVQERGVKAVANSLEDSAAAMDLDNAAKARHATHGVARQE